MNIHILNGDALFQSFSSTGIEGTMVICRECLIEGPVTGNDLEEFWNTRALFIGRTYASDRERYFKNVVTEFNKVFHLHQPVIYLWFEHDLFCQVNMWFTISLLQGTGITSVRRVNPAMKSEKEKWNGFAMHDADLLYNCYENSIVMTADDLKLGNDLWDAYRKNDLGQLHQLSQIKSAAFPFLDEVCKAESERKQSHRPQKTLSGILNSGETDFHRIFEQFWKQEAIYGFGDAQVQTMIDELKSKV